jgi:hypothetical protein
MPASYRVVTRHCVVANGQAGLRFHHSDATQFLDSRMATPVTNELRHAFASLARSDGLLNFAIGAHTTLNAGGAVHLGLTALQG